MNDDIYEFFDSNALCSQKDKVFWLDLTSQLIEAIPTLQDGQIYTLKSMFAKEYWNDVVGASHTTFGKHVSCMVSKGLLPLIDLGVNTSYSKIYQINPN